MKAFALASKWSFERCEEKALRKQTGSGFAQTFPRHVTTYFELYPRTGCHFVYYKMPYTGRFQSLVILKALAPLSSLQRLVFLLSGPLACWHGCWRIPEVPRYGAAQGGWRGRYHNGMAVGVHGRRGRLMTWVHHP